MPAPVKKVLCLHGKSRATVFSFELTGLCWLAFFRCELS